MRFLCVFMISLSARVKGVNSRYYIIYNFAYSIVAIVTPIYYSVPKI